MSADPRMPLTISHFHITAPYTGVSQQQGDCRAHIGYEVIGLCDISLILSDDGHSDRLWRTVRAGHGMSLL